MIFRNAFENELNDIFMMGYDVWSDGLNTKDYLLSCHSSAKYKTGQFKVLVENKTILASLIIYKIDENKYGLGSLAVPIQFRGKGYGSKILRMAVEEIELTNKDSIIFLFADINKSFYEKAGFVEIPKRYQAYKTTLCMVKTNLVISKLVERNFNPPKYF